jgi:homoaconitate hydratase family protein
VGRTLTEKIFARAAQRDVEVGEVVRIEADWCSLVDLGWYMVIPVFEELDVKPHFPDRITVHLDHKAPAENLQSAKLHSSWRTWCAENGVEHLHDVSRGGGISHQVLVEAGYAAPGRFLVHQDSHANTCGAMGCFAVALGVDLATDMVLGWNWHRVPPTIRIRLVGNRPSWLTALDIAHNICGDLGPIGALGAVIEFAGPVVDVMSIDDRLTICNRSRRIEAVSAVINPDQRTLEYVTPRAIGAFEVLTSDADCSYLQDLSYDVASMEPVVACPPTEDRDTKTVAEVAGRRVHQAFVGSCAGGRLDDIRTAAAIVKGRQVAPGVRFIVTPASHAIWVQAAAEGLWETLSGAGAIVTPSTCGLCYGGLNGILDDGELCIANSTENTVGRMGSREAEIFLGSTATVAASAVAGEIVDPRPYYDPAGVAA